MSSKRHIQQSEEEASMSEAEQSGEDDGVYGVEVIEAARVRRGKWQFWVKWAGYSSDDNTWEPKKNLEECDRLLDSFWDNVGRDDDDYNEGDIVKATPSWIKREKARFAAAQKYTATQTDRSEESDHEPGPSTAAVKEERARSKGKAPARQPSPKVPKKRGRPPKSKSTVKAETSDRTSYSSSSKGKKRARIVEDSSEDDQPLSTQVKPRPTIIIPPMKRPVIQPAQEASDGESSENSLFDEKEGSSPDVALGASTADPLSRISSTVPTKRPSMDDTANPPRKRQVQEMPILFTEPVGNSIKALVAQRPVSQKVELSKMSFKKKKDTMGVAGPSPIQTAVPALPRRSASTSDHPQSPNVSTPTIGQFSPASVLSPSLSETGKRIPLPRRSTMLQAPPAMSSQDDPMAEANRFLSDMLPSIASPLREEAGMLPPPVPVRTAPRIAALPRIQKKWKWSGQIFIDASRDKAEHVCDISLTDVTEPLANGLRFSICTPEGAIRFSSFHQLHAFPMFLQACSPTQQFAKVEPKEDKDVEPLKQLTMFMNKRALFCFAHVFIDKGPVGLLIMYPPKHKVAAFLLKVPTTMTPEGLQIALVPWELMGNEFRTLNWKPRLTAKSTVDPEFAPSVAEAGRKVISQRRFYQAIHILGFPKSVYDFMSQSNRPFCIWHHQSDRQSSDPGYETQLLQSILSTCGAKDLGHKADVRVVFVHVGSLPSFYQLPSLAERRVKQCDLRFMTYGTHPSVPHERWGVREIYPLGGIVTFTPAAIIEGHFRLFNRIKKIAEHPLWECYVLPSVVAMVAKLTSQGKHPLRVYDEGEFVYEELLKMIEDGHVGLLHAPELTRDASPQNDPRLLWTRWMLRLPSMNAREILAESLRVAAEQFANTSEADLPQAIEKEIARDLRRMQIQPTVVDNYRRFVVITSRSDKYFAEDSAGIEASSLSRFDFKDDFFGVPAPSGPAKK